VVGIALAFAALIVLAFWTFGGRTDVRRTQDRGQGTDEKEPDQTGED
jgi:hypothetical protein